MTIPFEARDAVRWTDGRLARGPGDRRFDRVSIDTRTLTPGALFVAIRGPQHDAHDFLGTALAAGALGLVVERPEAVPSEGGAVVIAVDDTTRALGALATGHRAPFRGPLVAVTGSNGKTTTKEMCAAILSLVGPCLKTRGNLNNAYGLPLTLLERDARHRSLVVELGMNHRGEIAQLARIARPTVGVITNVGTAHIEHLGSQEAIAEEKGDLVVALPPDGTAVLNADDPRVLAQAERCPATVRTFGLGVGADVRAERMSPLADGAFSFDLVCDEGRAPARVGGLGEPAVMNALAAATAALAAGATLADAVEGLGQWRPLSGRMEPRRLAGGGVLIDDTYNANPQSMEAALRALAARRGQSRALAVLGDMGELGERSREFHRRAGAVAAALGIDQVFSVGDFAEEVAAGAAEAGMETARIHVGKSHEELAQAVRGVLHAGDWVLVKGSRASRMERVVERLVEGADGEAA